MRFNQSTCHPITLASTLLAVLVIVTGCQTSHLKARALPMEMRAVSKAGKERIRLGGLLAASTPSSAIAPNDLLELTIATGLAGEEPMVHQSRVDADGTIDAPLVGRVAVAGLEASQAADQVVAASVTRGIYRRPQVSVTVTERATNQVTVLGSVSEPGTKELPRSGCDVLTAVAAAGGFTEEAGVKIEVLRAASLPLAQAKPTTSDDGQIQQVAFDAPALPSGSPAGAEVIDLANPENLPPGKLKLSDRDIVVVRPKEKRMIHVTGLVKTPDQFELIEDHDFRVLDAIAMAGGITTPVADKVLIVRQIEGRSEPVVVDVSISHAKTDGAENLVLQAGDLVSVESTASTMVLSTFQNLFRITMGVGGNLSVF